MILFVLLLQCGCRFIRHHEHERDGSLREGAPFGRPWSDPLCTRPQLTANCGVSLSTMVLLSAWWPEQPHLRTRTRTRRTTSCMRMASPVSRERSPEHSPERSLPLLAYGASPPSTSTLSTDSAVRPHLASWPDLGASTTCRSRGENALGGPSSVGVPRPSV